MLYRRVQRLAKQGLARVQYNNVRANGVRISFAVAVECSGNVTDSNEVQMRKG